MPNLAQLVSSDGYRRFAVSNPAQSEVSWTSIATGLNPGGHGLFDFVHRNPETYGLQVSLLAMRSSTLGTKFVPPHDARTFFDQAVEAGYPATSLWWPATFPARFESPVRTIPGLGVPDVLGRIGVGMLFTPDPGSAAGADKIPVGKLVPGGGAFSGVLNGPAKQQAGKVRESRLEFSLEIKDETSAQLAIERRKLDLKLGAWSPIIELNFKLGLFARVRAVTRAILTRAGAEPLLYFLPLQIHPARTPWRYAAPPGFAKKLWGAAGPFLTLGWPQDTTALEEGIISDQQFLSLCDDIYATRERIFFRQLETFNEGILANVFDTLDRIQHMFWRDRPDIVESWYERLDGLLGRVVEQAGRSSGEPPRLLVVSDHGFADFDYRVHLNRWLIEHGYLKNGAEDAENGGLQGADLSASKAYALGLNSLYLNLAGREGRGAVEPSRRGQVLQQLREDLLAWRGPDGRAVFQEVWTRAEAFEGDLSAWGPDMVMGYAPGYRASAETGLGGWGTGSVEANHDHWGADHCIDPAAVPGVLFSSTALGGLSEPSYRDFPSLALGKTFQAGGASRPPAADDPGEEAIEERLKGLGYL